MPKLKNILPGIKARLNRLRPRRVSSLRYALAKTFLKGSGVEIGALHQALPVHSGTRVRYVDRMDVAGLRKQYPELQSYKLVPVDIVDDGEKLATLGDASQDFIIANHFLEHTQNPLGTIERFMQVLKPGGCLYMAVPDKRWTFDIDRPVTPLDHLYRDYKEGPAWSREAHFREWCEKVNKASAADLDAQVAHLLQMDYSIHFHVWTHKELLEMLFDIRTKLKLPFELSAVVTNRELLENICVMTREN